MSSVNSSRPARLLALNVGSSSLKYAVFSAAEESHALLRGSVDRVDQPDRWLNLVVAQTKSVAAPHEWSGVVHRVVHGGPHFSQPVKITKKIIAELKRLIPFAPEHLPPEIALIEEVARKFPQLPQVACFDTAFHHELPRVASVLPLPRRYQAHGIRRYGFHGLSYEFLRDELLRLGDPAIKRGHVILAHLGNGASLAALRHGVCIDTTMSFTPAAGLVMGSRTGDIDPGLMAYLIKKEKLSGPQLNRLVSHESGLLGLSGFSSDTRKLLALEKKNAHAAEALAIFCQQTKKYLGSFAAALGGLDTLVFAGGIGEHASVLRARICDGLQFIGVRLDAARNKKNATVISSRASRVTVRVIATDEESVLARSAFRLLRRHPGAH